LTGGPTGASRFRSRHLPHTSQLHIQTQIPLAPQVKKALEELARIHIWDSGTSQHTFILEKNLISLRLYCGNSILGIGEKVTQPKAVRTYKVHAFVNGEHSFALLKDAL